VRCSVFSRSSGSGTWACTVTFSAPWSVFIRRQERAQNGDAQTALAHAGRNSFCGNGPMRRPLGIGSFPKPSTHVVASLALEALMGGPRTSDIGANVMCGVAVSGSMEDHRHLGARILPAGSHGASSILVRQVDMAVAVPFRRGGEGGEGGRFGVLPSRFRRKMPRHFSLFFCDVRKMMPAAGVSRFAVALSRNNPSVFTEEWSWRQFSRLTGTVEVLQCFHVAQKKKKRAV